ncbi:MAG: hypothetical protein EOM50_22790 [Erysipelotrichia bacterium]|nr:hypothetical protein [Erysipelotrichia bacterium]
MSKIIMGIQLQDRMNDATIFQSLLSKYGCSIQTRVGLHDTAANSCSPSGLILLDFVNDADDDAQKFEKEVLSLDNVNIQKMVF